MMTKKVREKNLLLKKSKIKLQYLGFHSKLQKKLSALKIEHRLKVILAPPGFGSGFRIQIRISNSDQVVFHFGFQIRMLTFNPSQIQLLQKATGSPDPDPKYCI